MMKQVFEFECDVPESVNHYLTLFIKRQGRKMIIGSCLTKKSIDFKSKLKDDLIELLKDIPWDLEDTRFKHYILEVEMIFARSDKDTNNYYKLLCDALNNLLYIDDKTILVVTKRMYITHSKEVEPHFKCKLYPAPYIGIWDSKEQYKEFIEKCTSCRNYKEGKCKRLDTYLNYVITDDFDFESKECKAHKEIIIKKTIKKKKGVA